MCSLKKAKVTLILSVPNASAVALINMITSHKRFIFLIEWPFIQVPASLCSQQQKSPGQQLSSTSLGHNAEENCRFTQNLALKGLKWETALSALYLQMKCRVRHFQWYKKWNFWKVLSEHMESLLTHSPMCCIWILPVWCWFHPVDLCRAIITLRSESTAFLGAL